MTSEANPNGSTANIAGILNEGGNVLGMMPHPERACEPLLGNDDGNAIWRSVLQSVGAKRTAHVAGVSGVALILVQLPGEVHEDR